MEEKMMTCRGLIYGMVHTTMYKKTSSVGNTRSLLMSRKVARTAAERERERGVRQQLEEEEEPIDFVTVFSDVPSFSPLILFISSSIPGH
jgi:hypothetical protein